MLKFITIDEAVAVSLSWQRVLPPRPVADTPAQRRRESIETLTAQRLLAYSQALCRWIAFDGGDEVLLVVSETGVWEEHRPLEQVIRDHLPGSDTVERRPALLLHADDLDYLVSYVYVCLSFGWGLSLICRSGSRWAKVDHDGRVWVGSSVANEVRAAQEDWLDW